jgi:hypothetical protein
MDFNGLLKRVIRYVIDNKNVFIIFNNSQTALQSDPALMNSTRKLRRLYFGNLPLHLGLTESLFQELVWIEMKNRGICNDPTQRMFFFFFYINTIIYC